MTGQSALFELLAGVALLLWATRLIRTGVERAFGEGLRRIIGAATDGRLRACLSGVGVATALQSASATTVLVAGFAQRGLVALPVAMALVLGADVGSALVVKFLAFDVRSFGPLILILGFGLFTWGVGARLKNIGRALIGLALVMTALGMIVAATQPLRGDALLPLILERLQGQPVLAFAIALLLAAVVQSSVAVILLVMSLASVGVIGGALAVTLVLGANAGSALPPLWAIYTDGVISRRIAVANLAFRFLGALACLPFASALAALLESFSPGPAMVANGHLAFNLLLCLAWLPWLSPLAALIERVVKLDAATREQHYSHLDETALATPAIALACAAREALRIADRVELMLREVILAFEPDNVARVEAVRKLDDEVDRAQEEIKLYLTRLTRSPLSEADSRKAFDLILFATNLEHVGDIIDKNLLDLAVKKERLKTAFSDEGWAELKGLHERAVLQARLAVTVFVTRDAEMARQLVRAKDEVRGAERAAADNHLRRLRDGKMSSLETSSLHLDILRDLKRIVAHLTNVAYPILEASGELRPSRLG